MARTVEFGEEPEDRRVIEDGEEIVAPLALEKPEMADPPLPAVTKTQARAAVNLRLSGASYSEIAEVMSYRDATIARKVVEETLARAYPDESRDSLFKQADARLLRLMKKVDEKTDAFIPERDEHGRVVRDDDDRAVLVANPEQLAYVRASADLNTRWMKLRGLEAPAQIEITPNAQAMEQWLAGADALMRASESPEGDPFEEVEDAIVIEDGELDVP